MPHTKSTTKILFMQRVTASVNVSHVYRFKEALKLGSARR